MIWLWVVSFTCDEWAVVMLCPTSTNSVRVDVSCYLVNGLEVYQVISIITGGHFTYMTTFGKIASLGLIFMTVHRRCTGSFTPNILSRGTTNKFCSDVDGVPVRL